MTPAPVEQSLPAALLFFFLTFAWERNRVHSRAKTNSDNHLIRVMYDQLSSGDKSSDDLECLAGLVVVIPELPVTLLVESRRSHQPTRVDVVF